MYITIFIQIGNWDVNLLFFWLRLHFQLVKFALAIFALPPHWYYSDYSQSFLLLFVVICHIFLPRLYKISNLFPASFIPRGERRERSSELGVSNNSQQKPCGNQSVQLDKLVYIPIKSHELVQLPSCKHTRCGNPTMNVDHLPREPMVFPHATRRLRRDRRSPD